MGYPSPVYGDSEHSAGDQPHEKSKKRDDPGNRQEKPGYRGSRHSLRPVNSRRRDRRAAAQRNRMGWGLDFSRGTGGEGVTGRFFAHHPDLRGAALFAEGGSIVHRRATLMAGMLHKARFNLTGGLYRWQEGPISETIGVLAKAATVGVPGLARTQIGACTAATLVI